MTPRRFAIEVTGKLQQAGFQALWAGGCVRDQLLGKEPKDYDVATNATPLQIQQLFGDRKTLALGAAFGVITVIGTRTSGNIEIATFRQDTDYSDGRRPDSVTFSTAEMDAQRRDFTINGIFFDPAKHEVIDFVDGEADLKQGVVRAIGDPALRIAEDKLRMLRAVRFAATLDFQIESDTFSTIKRHAGEISVVSAERISAELTRMLDHVNRRRAVELLIESGLLVEIVPEFNLVICDSGLLESCLSRLCRLHSGFLVALPVLLEPVCSPGEFVAVCKRLKLANEVSDCGKWVLTHATTLSQANQLPWSAIQPLLMSTWIKPALDFVESAQPGNAAVRFCRERLAWAEEALNPAPLLTGDTLRDHGFQPGPGFGVILNHVRQRQLDGDITSEQQALEIARQLDRQQGIEESGS